jgi:hypothetical protein
MLENGLVVSASGDHRDAMAVFGEPDGHNAADTSRSKNDEPHAQIVPRKRYCRDRHEPINRISAAPCRFVSPRPNLKATARVVARITADF